MTSSSTYAFQPDVGCLILNAYARCNIRAPELTAQHLQDAALECNLLSTQFTNRLPMQYLLETISVSLTDGVATYNLPNRTVAIGLAYATVDGIDRPLGPISATDYAAISNKSTQGVPTSIWLSLQPIPTVTVWPVPDQAYTLNIQSFRQQQDVSVQNGQTLDMPYRFLDAFTAGLAARLARLYAPALYAVRQQDFEAAFAEASQTDQENVALVIMPQLAGYMR